MAKKNRHLQWYTAFYEDDFARYSEQGTIPRTVLFSDFDAAYSILAANRLSPLKDEDGLPIREDGSFVYNNKKIIVLSIDGEVINWKKTTPVKEYYNRTAVPNSVRLINLNYDFNLSDLKYCYGRLEPDSIYAKSFLNIIQGGSVDVSDHSED